MNIHGAKKGGGKQRQPVIAPDSAQSKTFISIMYGLGEGEIAGLANGYKSVYLEDTPLQNDNGEFNFPNVKVDFRTGTNDQEYIDGFPDVASETAVNVELKHGTPFVKAFNNLDLDALRVRLKWGALRQQNRENGDVSGVKIDYAIDVKTDNGGWVEALNTSINAKTSDAYERSHRIDLPKAQTGWQLRVRRITPNSTSEFISDKMYIAAISEVIDLKLRYPNTAVMGLRYDAESFSNVAKMSVRCKGLIIKVPTNYDPVARTYTGMWDGQFKMAYSNNPAWVYYDLCTAERYGLGGRLTQSMIDKWSLYRLAQYCDEMVDDGMGGQEPRFTVNVYIQSADGAFELLSRLAGVFRAISYWDGNSIVLDADIPQDSIYSFSRANVIDGVFEYTGTRSRDRRTVAKVAWDNPANHFKTEYEYVRDEAAIAKFGVRVADIAAWGCTSRGQAQRAGLWALKSEQLETRMVTFKVGLDGLIPAPAKVIEISDELFAGRATGGRVLAINKAKTIITLDRTITAKTGDTLVINGDDGTSQRQQIRSVNGDKVTVTKAFGDISMENVWVLDSADLATMKFRVLSVTADENHQFTITAVQYNPAKYDAIDHGAYIDERPISVINPTVQAPTKSVNLSSYHTVNQGVSITTLVIGWEQVAGAVKYAVEWRKDNGNWQSLPPTGTNSIEITGVYAGQYEARVTAISAFGQASLATHSNLTEIQGKVGKPNRPAFIRATGVLFGMNLVWGFAAGSDDTNFTEIQVSPDGRTNITALGTFAYPTNKHEITGLQGNLTQYYRARIVDKLGNTSDWTAWTSGTTEARADKVLDIISGQINQSHLDQTLRTPIGKISTLENAVNAVNGNLSTLNSQLANTQNELNTAKNTLQTAVGNITTERNRINTAIRDITVLQTANNTKTQEIANLTQTTNGHTSSIRELGVTTGDLSQKYSQLKTATDTANSEITAIKQTQNGQATSIERLSARFDNGNLFKVSTATNGHFLDENNGGQLTAWGSHRASDFIAVKTNTVYEIRSFEGNFGNLRVMWYDADKTFIKGQIIARGGDYATFDSENASFVRISSYWTRTDNNVWQMQVAGLASDVGANLETLRQTLTNADTALSQQITAMDTAYKSADRTLTANLASETTARTSADTALGQRIDTLQTDYNGNKASVANQLKTLSDKDTATATQISQLTANVSTAQQTANTANGKADTATTKADNAQNTANNALTRANTANSAITAEQKARADADTALGQRISAIDTAYKSADSQTTAKLGQLEQSIGDKDRAMAQRVDTLNANYTALDNRTKWTELTAATDLNTLTETGKYFIRAGSNPNAPFAQWAYVVVEKARNDRITQTAWADNNASLVYTRVYNGAWRDWEKTATGKELDTKATTASLNEFKQAQATKDTATAERIANLDTAYRNADNQLSGRITTAQNTATNAQNAVATARTELNARFDGLAVGGRNLLKNSNPSVANANYMHRFELTNAPSVGDEVVVTLWGDMGADRTGIGVYNTQGYTELFKLAKIADGVYQGKGRWRLPMNGSTPRTPNDTHLNVYFYPNSATSQNRIDRIKLEKGNVATDWTPAPEDLQADINNKANATALNDLSTRVTQVDGRITAEANKVNQLQTTLNGQTTSIRNVEQSVNGVRAIKAVTVDNNGFISGYGLMSELQNGRVTSRFGINADQIYFGATTTAKKPFVFATRTTTIDGVSYPAGAWLNSASIANASIKLAHIDKASIGNLSALSAKIGHFKSAETGARLEIKDSLLMVYDENNVLRVRLGLW
ncbi:TipJ family phage tail tip protein [Moraxella bovis]|uniref:TipJ family phage tail tip protein n=1 Tax=Moraxella bovis TaxID=476 RepID=UPI001FD1EA0A|nr:phage tail protein [Moraxella bovis]